MSWGAGVNHAVKVGDKRGKIRVGVHGLGPKGCLEESHEQSGTDSLAGHIPNRDTPSVRLQGKKIVIVATDALGRLIEGLAGQSGNRQIPQWKKGSLNIFCAL